MRPIIFELDTLVNIVENSFKAQIVRMEFDIVKDTAYSVRMLYPGFKYGIFAYGDYRLCKIGVDIMKQNEGKMEYVTSGNFDEKSCTTLGWVEPTEPTLYTFKIYAADRKPDFKGAHYGIIIFN